MADHPVDPRDDEPYGEPPKKVTLSGKPAEPGTEGMGAPAPIDPATGMHKDYWVLSEAERSKGFVEPFRNKYVHDKCGVLTKMGDALSETYARQPDFYGSTFCVGCKTHFPVGEFLWDGTNVRVGARTPKAPDRPWVPEPPILIEKASTFLCESPTQMTEEEAFRARPLYFWAELEQCRKILNLRIQKQASRGGEEYVDLDMEEAREFEKWKKGTYR